MYLQISFTSYTLLTDVATHSKAMDYNFISVYYRRVNHLFPTIIQECNPTRQIILIPNI